jgi:hypothetical protein
LDPSSSSRDWLALALALALVVLALQAAAARLARWRRRRAILARVARAGDGEARAARRLVQLGYAIEGAQVVAEYEVRVDGAPVTASVRADYVVAKDGARFVAEVKTGAVAPRIETPATRRQLLEYRVAFDVDGVLLVDAERGSVHEVVFSPLARAPARSPWPIVLLAAAIAAAVVLAR